MLLRLEAELTPLNNVFALRCVNEKPFCYKILQFPLPPRAPQQILAPIRMKHSWRSMTQSFFCKRAAGSKQLQQQTVSRDQRKIN